MFALIPLGVNGLGDCYDRHSMSFLLLTPSSAIVIDAGTGLSRLVEPPIQQQVDRYSHLHIILSHYHFDHISGLFSLLECRPDKPTSLYCPQPPLVDGTMEALVAWLSPPFLRRPLTEIIDLHLTSFNNAAAGLAIGPHLFRLRRNNHPGGSVSFRLDDTLAYVTDTPVDPESIPFISGVHLLLHEVWLTDEETISDPGEASRHSSVSAVARLARQAGVRALMPIHLRPTSDNHRPSRLFGALSRALLGSETMVLLPLECLPYQF